MNMPRLQFSGFISIRGFITYRFLLAVIFFYSGFANAQDTDQATISVPQIQHPQLLSLAEISTFIVADDETLDFQYPPVLLPLQRFTRDEQLTIDTRVGALTLITNLRPYNIAKNTSQLVPLAQLADQNQALANATAQIIKQPKLKKLREVEALTATNVATPVNEIDLPELKDVPTSPTLFLRDFRLTYLTELTFDSNPFASQEPVSAWYLKNDVTASLALQRRGNTYLGSFSVIDNRELDGVVQPFTNRRSYISVKQELGRRKVLNFDWRHDVLHETLGNGLLENIRTNDFTALAVERNQYTLGFTLGDDESKFRLATEVSSLSQVYDETTAIIDIGSYDTELFKLEARYNLGSKTALLAELNLEQFDARLDNSEALQQLLGLDSLDASSQRYDLGVSRDIGRASNLKLQVGQYSRQFDTSALNETSNVWRLEYTLNRKTYSRISASIGQRFLPSQGIGAFIQLNQAQFTLTHTWSSKLKSRSTLRLSESLFIGTNRVDDRVSLTNLLEYSPRNNWRISTGLRWIDRRSNVEAIDFDRTLLFIRSQLQF